MMSRILFYVLSLGLISSCQKESNEITTTFPDLWEVPEHFPKLTFPEGNEYTQARWELGKKLFYDPIMSIDGKISCASCHDSGIAFSDNVSFSVGVNDLEGTRNAPSLANVAYHPYFTREGGVPTLEMQVLVPIQEHNEFGHNIVAIASLLEKDSLYHNMSLNAYDRTPDPFVITRSIALFERSLISGRSTYDRYLEGEVELTQDEMKGMDLFFSNRLNCSQCHSGFNFTNYSFENNGLYKNYEDSGRFRLTSDSADIARFKVPSLRNIEVTAPYMHDGSIKTLEEVIDHYNNGGKNHMHKSNLIKNLNLSEDEKSDLVKFLKTLTDEKFLENPLFRDN